MHGAPRTIVIVVILVILAAHAQAQSPTADVGERSGRGVRGPGHRGRRLGRRGKGAKQSGESWFCGADNTSHWRAELVAYVNLPKPRPSAVRVLRGRRPAVTPRYYCDVLPVDTRPWNATLRHPPRYTPDDLAVGIYTGENIVLSRGLSVLDTWLPRHSVVYSSHAVPAVPTVGMVEERPISINRGAHLVQLRGLADLYRRFPDRSWYYIVGDDTYLNVDYALRMLDGYDASKPWWITKAAYPAVPFG